MNQLVRVTGMVISAVSIGEHDKRVVILTRERGKISAFARGARRPRSPLQAGTESFAFGDFWLREGRDSYTIDQITISNYFRELVTGGDSIYYGYYFLELADYYGKENADDLMLLKLLYQTCRALMKPNLSRPLIRRIFELKALEINGEYPQMFSCGCCGGREDLVMYSTERGGAVCAECGKLPKDGIEISPATVYAMQFVLSSPIEKLYTFQVSEQVQKELAMVLNRHMDRYVDKKFKSLDILQVMVENIP